MTRKILRNRARLGMKNMGITRINKRYWMINPVSGLREQTDSYFSRNWREFAGCQKNSK